MQNVNKAALPAFTLEIFPNLGDVSEEHRERFHQDILAMMGDYIWCLIRDDDKLHKRKPRSTVSF